jgi:hypothetical protein
VLSMDIILGLLITQNLLRNSFIYFILHMSLAVSGVRMVGWIFITIFL